MRAEATTGRRARLRSMRDEGQAHLRLARLNEGLARRLADEAERLMRCPAGTAAWAAGRYLMGWAIIILYYAALHYIDALLDGCYGWQSPTHDAQDANIARIPSLKRIGCKYKSLRAASIEARYRGKTFDVREWRELERDQFRPIKQEMLRRVGRTHLQQRVRVGWI